MRDRICDVCGCKIDKGIKLKGFRKKTQYMCEKCENTLKLTILQVRKKREA